MNRRSNLQRIGKKLRNFLTQRNRQHSTRFRRIFADSVTPEEQLISSFGCLYYNEKADSLIPGRLFVTFDHLAFDANNLPVRFILSWSNNVNGVEKTSENLLEISGGIRILLDDGIVCTFGSFSGADKVYALMLRLWKTNGRRFTTRQQFELSNFESQMRGTQTDGSQIGQTDTSSETTDDAKPGDHEPTNCACKDHKGQLVLDSAYPINTNQLFRFLFTENPLMRGFLTSIKRTGIRSERWIEVDELSRGQPKRRRTTTYTVELANTWGPRTSNVTERQTFIEIGKRTGDGYIIKKDAANSGIPYADSFNVFCTYCITRVSDSSCRLQVHAGIEFKKSIMFKGFIERMATSGINEYYKNLGTYLQSHHERIQKEMSGGGMVAGKDLILERPSRGSFHSLSDSNDGYASDVDECGDISNKRPTKSFSYAAVSRSNVASPHNKMVNGRSLLSDINHSLRLIAVILVLILAFQLYNFFSAQKANQDASGLLPNAEELLSRLILEFRNANFADVRRREK